MSTSASCTRAVLLSISFIAVTAAYAYGADPKPKTDAAKIANALTAAPAEVSRNASVAEMNEDGSMKMLRKGTGEWTCVPDDPSTPGNDPMCLDPNAMEWLHTYMIKSAPPDKIGFIYMLKGGQDFSNTDPFATKPEGGKATITGPHVMVVGPGVKSIPGYDRTGEGVNPAIPYVMWKDTPYEHLMIPVRQRPVSPKFEEVSKADAGRKTAATGQGIRMTATIVSDADVSRYRDDGALCLRSTIPLDWTRIHRMAFPFPNV